jgi:23S rRNA (guanosine2251-2'-O)-methyltransferase
LKRMKSGKIETLYGVHPVMETLRGGRRRVEQIHVSVGRQDRKVREILSLASRKKIPVQRVPRESLDRLAGGGVHQGVVARVSGSGPVSVEEILATAGTRPFFLILDQVEDPRNLGAILRSAAAARVDGVFLPPHGSAGLTPAAAKAAAGQADRVRLAVAGNLVSLMEKLKERGIWVVGLDQGARTLWTEFDYSLPVALVLGGEGKGIRRLVREHCDVLVGIPLSGGVDSLNVSVAAGVTLFEVVRQRGSRGAGA